MFFPFYVVLVNDCFLLSSNYEKMLLITSSSPLGLAVLNHLGPRLFRLSSLVFLDTNLGLPLLVQYRL